jgi:peptide/nickel transport system substrate-binding protein
MRRALVMAVDRQKLVRSVFDSLAVPATGPFIRAAAPAIPPIPQIPYDTARAGAKLDSLGWRDTDGDGLRDRNGRPLRFALLVPGTSAFRVRMGVLLQEEFRRVGVDMRVEQIDINVMQERQNARRFEAIFGGWNLDPSPSGIRQTFTTAAAKPGGYNYTHYSNPVFDALVDSAFTTMDATRSHEYYARAYEIIAQDAPVIFMYEFQGLAGAHRRLNITGMRPHAWWAGIPDWSIPGDQRIDRDRIGLRVAPQ